MRPLTVHAQVHALVLRGVGQPCRIHLFGQRIYPLLRILFSGVYRLYCRIVPILYWVLIINAPQPHTIMTPKTLLNPFMTPLISTDR